LRRILLPALGDGDGILEDAVVVPELELLERGTASEEVEDGAYDGLLVVVEGDTGGGLDAVDVLDVETGDVWVVLGGGRR